MWWCFFICKWTMNACVCVWKRESNIKIRAGKLKTTTLWRRDRFKFRKCIFSANEFLSVVFSTFAHLPHLQFAICTQWKCFYLSLSLSFPHCSAFNQSTRALSVEEIIHVLKLIMYALFAFYWMAWSKSHHAICCVFPISVVSNVGKLFIAVKFI